MSLMFSLLLVFASAFLVTGLWLSLARRRNWFDHPNHRSSHVQPMPKSGGAGFVVAFSCFALWLYLDGQLTLAQLSLSATALLLAAMGFADDLRSMAIWKRIGLQVVAAGIALWLLDPVPRLEFPWGELGSVWVRGGLLALGLVWLVNLYNFMDGIDGLAAMETIFFCLSLAVLTGSGGAPAITVLSLGLAFAVSGFLYFNLPPARLFMGDLGSNYLGYIVGILGGMAMQSESVNMWTILVLLGVFMVDATTTLIRRMRSGAVWYHAHRSHAYQQAASRWNSHGKVVSAIALINVCWLLPLAWLTTVFGNWGMLITVIAWVPLHLVGKLVRQPPRVPTSVPTKAG